MTSAASGEHARLMDGIYRRQRHFYDATRKFYLLGRDRMIAGLNPPSGGTVLEIGCGTGRNMVLAAQRHPAAALYGIDISSQMLESARIALDRAGLAERASLARADAVAFDPQALFGAGSFDRIYMSYTLSMIPQWERAIGTAVDVLAPGGSLHVVDFGQQERLPGWFRTALRMWLARFHVTPRAALAAELAAHAERRGGRLHFEPLYRGYAWHGVITLPRA